MTTVHIRNMTPDDLDFATSCTQVVGWFAQRSEFEGFYAHDPQGCLVAEAEPTAHGGPRIGICIATPYDGCGFIGMLIVLPEARGCGVGSRLLEHAIDYLHGRGARIIGLDAVLAAVPLYERLGFQKRCRSLRFSGTLREQAHPSVRPMTETDLDAVCALDREAFGADRRFFLVRRLAREPRLCKVLEQDGQVGGFVFGQRGKTRISAGPWVVRPEVARSADLLESLALEAGQTTIGLGILESNAAAVAAVRALGLTANPDSPWRMVRVLSDAPGLASGQEALGVSPLAYAIGSPAKG